jgi:tetratricopeptide (TPR) repeat protein
MFRAFFVASVFLCFFSAAALTQEKADDVPYRQDAGLITAEYYLATGKYAQALQVLGGVLKRHPRSADAYVYRGYAHEKLGDMPKASADYKKALAIDPGHLGANRYLAGLYLQQGDRALAFEQLQAIRAICAGLECPEQTELENLINKAKKPASP